MNYGKKGVRNRQKALNATSQKWSRKIGFTFVQIFLVALIGVGIIGASAGIAIVSGLED